MERRQHIYKNHCKLSFMGGKTHFSEVWLCISDSEFRLLGKWSLNVLIITCLLGYLLKTRIAAYK